MKRPPSRLFVAWTFSVLWCLAAVGRAEPWTHAAQSADTAVFAHPSPPRLERHDLAEQRWLAPFGLPSNATALAADTNAWFVACGRSVYRVDPASGQTTLLFSHTNAITELTVLGEHLCFGDRRSILGTAQKATGLLADMRQINPPLISLMAAPGQDKLLGVYQSGWTQESQSLYGFTVSANGQISKQSPDYANSSGGTVPLLRTSPNLGLLISGSGQVWNLPGLTEFGSVSPKPRDAVFFGSTLAVLGLSNVVVFDQTLTPIGEKSLDFSPERIFASEEGLTVFASGTGSESNRFMRIPWSEVGTPEPGAPLDPTEVSFVPDQIEAGGDGVVYLLSSRYRSLFRWSTTNLAWLPTLPLIGPATNFVVAPVHQQALYIGYPNGRITRINLSTNPPRETVVNQSLTSIHAMVLAGDTLLASDINYPARAIALSASGQLLQITNTSFPHDTLWNPRDQRLTFIQGSYVYQRLFQAGRFYDPEYRYLQMEDSGALLALSSDGQKAITGGGAVVDLLAYTATNRINQRLTDALWTQQGLTTLREIGAYLQIQNWSGSYQPLSGRQIEGRPYRLLATGTNFLVVSLQQGQIRFTLLDSQLQTLHESPLAPAPTDILLSNTGVASTAPGNTVIGEFTVLGGDTMPAPRLELLDNASGRFALVSNRLVLSYESALQPGFPQAIVVRASGRAGASLTKDFTIVATNAEAPAVSFHILRPDLFEDTYDGTPPLEIRRTGPTDGPLTVQLTIGGTATKDQDYWVEGSSSWEIIQSFYIPAGSNSVAVRLSVRFDGVRDSGETIEFHLFPNARYVIGPASTATLVVWETKLDHWLSHRLGYLPSLAESGPDGDPDGNGVSNFAEYYGGALAALDSPYPRPAPTRTVDNEGRPHLSVLFSRRNDDGAAERDFLVSTNLVDWTLAIPTEQVLAVTNGVETVRWSVPAPDSGAFFGNLRLGRAQTLRSPDRVVPDLGLELVGLPNRSFDMGSSYEDGRYPDEGPEFRVSFTHRSWMARHETTQRQYATLMSNNPSWLRDDDAPVHNVTWFDATEFCRRLTEREQAAGRLPAGYAYRLPTEAEWESAACGRDGQFLPHNFGAEPLASAWFAPNSGFTPHPVGTRVANDWGLHDLAGNVAEWCSDWYGAYPQNQATDPRGPVSGVFRVVRGGSFADGLSALRTAARSGALPNEGTRFVGFRVVLALAHN